MKELIWTCAISVAIHEYFNCKLDRVVVLYIRDTFLSFYVVEFCENSAISLSDLCDRIQRAICMHRPAAAKLLWHYPASKSRQGLRPITWVAYRFNALGDFGNIVIRIFGLYGFMSVDIVRIHYAGNYGLTSTRGLLKTISLFNVLRLEERQRWVEITQVKICASYNCFRATNLLNIFIPFHRELRTTKIKISQVHMYCLFAL